MPEIPAADSFLLRIPDVFAKHSPEILGKLGASPLKRLASDYQLVRPDDPAALQDSDWAAFVKWRLPVHHAWPCNPQKMEGFVEKAAQAIARKFGGSAAQALFTGPLQTSAAHPFYKHLATNLRGRTLQLFPAFPVQQVEEQAPDAPTLFCLVGKEGLFCGLATPREANGFYPGGTKFISQNSESTISRAGAKIAEALHYLRLYRPLPETGAHWLELGASPGGMSSELLARGYRVTAVDKAAMDARLTGHEGLTVVRGDVDTFQPPEQQHFDALLCDMNGDARASLRQVARLSSHLNQGSLIVFTLKGAGIGSPEELVSLCRAAKAFAAAAGLGLIACTHLTYNRHELTLFLRREK